MKRFLLCTIILIANSILINAHWNCRTPNIPDSLTLTRVVPSRTSSNESYHVRVFFHIIQRSDGTSYYGFSDSNIPNVLQILNNDFNQLSIYFDYAGVDFINNTSFHDMTNLDNSPLINSVINTFVHSNAIDIYLFPTVADIEGYSSGIPGRAIALMGHQGAYMYSDSHLISHEMGHCLGLLHTFHGGVDEAGPCAELVDGSNSDVCGDFVSDTPADPFRLNNYVDDLCFWNNNTVRDANGQLYKPDTRQIMAYVPIRCMQNLTFGQGDRMRATIATCQLLQDRLTSSVVYVQNQQFAGNGEEIVMAYDSVKAGNNVTNAVAGDVIIPAGGNVTFEAGQRIVLKPGFIVNSGAKFKAKISNIRTANYTSKRKNCDYIPLLHNTSWTTISRYFESPMMASVYQCIGDTLICEKNHKIIKQTVINLSDSTIIPDVNPNITTQCLYEDIEHQRVYQYSDYYKRDILLYDFSIQIGERMPSDSLGSSADSLYILKDIELVENSGYARKEYTFVYGTDTIVWLEGIGNITNFTIPHARKNLEHSRILCVRNGDETVYNTDAFYDYTCESIKHIYEDPSHEDFSRPVGNDYRAAKLLRNNQILILRGDHTYTITGQEVIMP